jgi:ferredoxin
MVEAKGNNKLLPACMTKVQEGMEITTETPTLAENRKMIVEMLFVEGNHICAVCVLNGHCELQDMAGAVGLRDVRYGYEGANHLDLPIDISNPYFAFDPSKCIVCSRCVRACDEVQGTFALQTTNPASPLAQTQTVVSDANGEARAVIAVPAATPTQIGLIRATELATGSQTTFQFVIAQVTAGEGVLSVAPSGNTTITGPAQNICSSGVRVSYYVFGGTPPYRVVLNFPDAVTLVGNPVTVNGGGFDVITNGSCFTNLTFAITDATGRTISNGLPTVTNQPGTQAPVPPTPTPTLVITPPTQSVIGNCGSTRTYQFAVTGGNSPYSVVLGQPTGWTVTGTPVQSSGGTFLVSGPGNQTVTVVDSGGPQQTVTASITCTTPTP